MRIAVVGVLEPQIEEIFRTNGLGPQELSFSSYPDVDALVSELDETFLLVVLAAQIRGTEQVIHRLQKRFNDLAFLVLKPPACGAELTHQLQGSPLAGSDVAYTPLDDPGLIAGTIRQMINRALQRRNYRRVVDANHSFLTRMNPLRPQPVKLLGQLLNSAPIGVLLLDKTGIIIAANSLAQDILHVPAQQLLKQPFRSLFPDAQQKSLEEFFERCIACKDPQPPITFLQAQPDGSSAYLTIRMAAVEGRKGDRFQMVILQDETEGKRAELEARKNEERVGKILDCALDAVIRIDQAGVITEWNPQAEAIFGWKRDEMVGRKMLQILMPEEYRDAYKQGLKQFLNNGDRSVLNRRLELSAVRKNGEKFPVEIAISVIQMGDEYEFSAFVRDITEKNRLEWQRQRYEERLKLANAALLRSNQELDDFAYIASHDLKEPLRGIRNYADFLLEDCAENLDEKSKGRLETIKTLTSRMESLINSLLYYSRLGRAEMAFGMLDLNEIVREVIESLAITIEREKIQVRIAGSLPKMVCDRARVGEIFQNLITNAMKYNDKPEKWIEIGSANGDALYVRDNGIGIKSQHYQSIFQIFKRLHPRDQFGGGSGVGLTFIKKIIERHGGRIWVESTPGEGSTFYFTLKPERKMDPLEEAASAGSKRIHLGIPDAAVSK